MGNSLTHDSRSGAFPNFSAQRGTDHEVGFHIRTSKSLTQIAAQPGGASEVPNATGPFWTQIGERRFDVVTLQTYPKNATLGSETAAAVEMIDRTLSFAGNTDTRFLLYGGWPTFYGDYAEQYGKPLNGRADPGRR